MLEWTPDLEKKLNSIKKSFEIAQERLTVISKENAKVNEENEMLKERLRNLGITDFDVI